MKPIIKKLYGLFLTCIPENRLGDKLYSFIKFFQLHRRLPGSKLLFNDVLYSIKTSNEIMDPLRVFVSDKELVKLFVTSVVGEQYNVPTIKILHSIEEVKAYAFPSDCCVKPTHLSGTVILRKQGGPVEIEKIERWLKESYYRANREANYKTLKRKVIVEPLIFGSDNLDDYKVFCYNGIPKLIQVDMDRHINHTESFFDTEWNLMPFSIHYPRSKRHTEKPKNLDKMLAVASALGSYFNFVRIDLYSNGEDCLVGEITNCPGGATGFMTKLYSNGLEHFAGENGNYQAEIMASNIIFGNFHDFRLQKS